MEKAIVSKKLPLEAVISQEYQINGLSKKLDKSTKTIGSINNLQESQCHHWDTDEFSCLASVLDSLDEIKILQHLDVVEVCLGLERNNRYSLYNKNGEQILYTYEAAQCFARQCFGSLRGLTLVITDNDDNRLLFLQRPLRCSSRCFYACCCLQTMVISTSDETNDKLAVVNERWTCCLPEYSIEDSLGNVKFTLHGTLSHCRCCCNITFTVKSQKGFEVASITSQWGGWKEFIGACNEFTIHYFEGLTKEEKGVILGATFLLDFNYFSRHGKCV